MPNRSSMRPRSPTLQRDTAVTISAQQGLWYQLQLAAGKTGYVRVNDVRVALRRRPRTATRTCAR